ncbi:MAG: decaprenylphospho-beta-D-erythro-pentofuranosid-2-ulose 2-reductase, partial [Propionibacteriaceae bacterium]
MINATGNPSSLLLLGGTSDIALAIARTYAGRGPGLRVVLAARPGDRRTAAAAE